MNSVKKITLSKYKDVSNNSEFKRAWKPILPKLPHSPVPTETLRVSSTSKFVVRHGNCYVCGSALGKFEEGVLFVRQHMQAKSNLVNRLCEIMGDSYMVVVVDDDVLCTKCNAVLTQVDNLEKTLQQLKSHLKNLLLTKYCKEVNDFKGGQQQKGLTNGKTVENPATKTAKQSVFDCGMCDLRFESPRSVRRHKMKAHLTLWTCHFCNEVMKDEKVFTDHMKTHLTEQQETFDYPCPICDDVFMSAKDLLAHKATHEEDAVKAESPALSPPPEDMLTDLPSHETLNVLDLGSLDKPDGLSFDGFEGNPESVDLINIFNNQDANMQQYDKYVCASCNAEYDSAVEMNKHIQDEHELKQCSLCPDVLGSKEQVDAHVWEVHNNPDAVIKIDGDNVFTCQFCGAVATNEETLQLHLQECKPLVCGSCGAVAESEEVLQAHMEVCGETEGEVESREEDPLAEGEGETMLDESATSPKKQRYILCTACGDTFPNKAALAEHEEQNPDHLEIQCPDCELRFHREKFLNDHRSEAHTELHCRHCNKLINNLKQLKAHETRHARSYKTIFKCSTCEKVFQTATGLRNHVATHTGDYKYSCDFCGKGFVTRPRYEEHRACHTKEARYECEICHRKFAVQATYWIHRKWHDNPFPYQCRTCGQRFKHSSLLSVHIRKHTGERPYACEFCDQTFQVGASLKRHMSLHTGTYRYNCEICKTGFTAKHKMAQHMSKIHNDHSLVLEQIKHKSRNFVMAVRDPDQQEVQTWVQAAEVEDQSTSGNEHLLTLNTEDGEILLTEEGFDEKVRDGQFIVLQSGQTVQYQMESEDCT